MTTDRRETDPEAGPPEMVKGVGVPGRRPRTHAPEGWPGPVSFDLEPGRWKRLALIGGGLAVAVPIAHQAFGARADVGVGLAGAACGILLALVRRAMLRPRAVRLTREGLAPLGGGEPSIAWTDVTAVDLDPADTLRLTAADGTARSFRLRGGDAEALAWAAEGWWRYATRPW